MKQIIYITNNVEKVIEYLNKKAIPYKLRNTNNSSAINLYDDYIELEVSSLNDKQYYQYKKMRRKFQI